MNDKNLAHFSEESFERHFKKQVSLLSEGKKTQEKPVAYLLGGQPGAGKSNLHAFISDKLDENVVIIDNDSFKKLHPNFELLAKKYGKDYVTHVTPFSNRMTEALIEYFSNQRYNLVIEGTLRTAETPIKTASFLKEKGYDVNLYVMAVSKDLSYLGTLQRYEAMYLKDPLTARATPKKHHDETVNNIPDNLDKLFKGGYFTDISIFTREGTKLYSSIETPSVSPKEIIHNALNQPLTKDVLIEKIDSVIKLAKQNNHEIPELMNWKKELKEKNNIFSMNSIKKIDSAIKEKQHEQTKEKNKNIFHER